MSDDPWLRFSEGPCRHLRCKEMYYDTGVPLEERCSSGIFWCNHTHKPLGPDDSIVSLEDCMTSRPCFER